LSEIRNKLFQTPHHEIVVSTADSAENYEDRRTSKLLKTCKNVSNDIKAAEKQSARVSSSPSKIFILLIKKKKMRLGRLLTLKSFKMKPCGVPTKLLRFLFYVGLRVIFKLENSMKSAAFAKFFKE